MKILIFVAVLLAVCGQSAVNVQADVIECDFLINHMFNPYGILYKCEIKSVRQDENQNVIIGSHETGKSDSDVDEFFVNPYAGSKNLTNFDSTFCQKFPKLKRIHFETLKPTNLIENALHGCTNLNFFELIKADIKQIPDNFFSNNLKLTKIDLSFNRLEELPKGIFVRLEKLEFLLLQGNNLMTIHADSFGEKPQLTFVDLSDNKITSIDEKFIDNTIIDWLSVKGNSCSKEIIKSRDKMKEKLQQCFENHQPRQHQATTPKGCGVAKVGTGNIIGGDFIELHTYPWIAAITDPEGNYFCGGVVVSDWKVLTAAHCLQDKNQFKPRLPGQVKVLLGTHNLNELYQIGRRAFAVEKIHIHDDWNPFSTRYDADIAVMVLNEQIVFNKFIQPICLIHDLTSPVYSIDTGIVVGYGKSEDESKNHENIPKIINVPITNNEICVYGDDSRVSLLAGRRTFCGGYKNGTGVCKGDSGNGLMIRHNNVYYLRGLVSSSPFTPDRTCDVYTYSIFTNIAEYQDWINGISVDPFAK